ncbi:hypothetical protein [Streptomyces sp. NPDC094032]|uniref:hypothetical protein n=1 Tax=Streptomyces sp. NPDC094032 TaxID=3155308 RepID=UPI003329BCEB
MDLDLGDAMRSVYRHAASAWRERLLDTTPVILALFDGAGGRLLLHTPGRPPVSAPPVPAVYQRLKDLAHAPVAAFELATSPTRVPREAHDQLRTALAHALKDLGGYGLGPEEARAARAALGLCDRLLTRLDDDGRVPEEHVGRFARECAPLVLCLTERAADAQVGHWTKVLDSWQAELGGSLEHVYAAVNTVYVTRTKNILFTVLAQYVGEQAIGERLFLFETSEFTTTEDRMLDLLTRVVADRELGRAFFGQGRVMDVEILGDAAREAVRREMARRGREALLPTTAPYDNRQWPWATACADPAAE